MFYEQNQFDSLLTCPICSQRFDVPLMLPCCWKTVCNKCTQKITTTQTCSLCKNQHLQFQTKRQLPVNEAILKLLDLKPVDLIHTDIYLKLSDLFKFINSNLDELERIEKHTETNITQYFTLLKTEISNNVELLIQKTLCLKKTLLNDLDYLEKKFLNHFQNLSLNNLKTQVQEKLKKWQNNINDASFKKLDKLLIECENLNGTLDEKIRFISQNLLNTNKIVFNQKYELDSLLESYVGHVEFEPFLDPKNLLYTVKYLNNLVKVDKIDLDLNLNLIYVRPFGFKKILFVSKNDYDEYTEVKLQVCDTTSRSLYEHTESKSKINYVQTSINLICISLTDYQTGRNILKLYNEKLYLIKMVFLDNPVNYVCFNSEFIYVKIDNMYPFLHKFDLELNKQDLFDNSTNDLTSKSDILVSLAVDKIICIEKSRIYMLDKCFSSIKIYSELTGDLVETVEFKYARDCFVMLKIDECEMDLDEKIICLNKTEKNLGVYDKYGNLIVENKLDASIKNINEFFICHDGSLMFLDSLNDAIYYYNV